MKGVIIMPRKTKEIGVILHIPKDNKSLQLLQNITNEFYAKMVMKKLERTDLSQKEKKYVVKKLSEHFAKSTAKHQTDNDN